MFFLFVASQCPGRSADGRWRNRILIAASFATVSTEAPYISFRSLHQLLHLLMCTLLLALQPTVSRPDPFIFIRLLILMLIITLTLALEIVLCLLRATLTTTILSIFFEFPISSKPPCQLSIWHSLRSSLPSLVLPRSNHKFQRRYTYLYRCRQGLLRKCCTIIFG